MKFLKVLIGSIIGLVGTFLCTVAARAAPMAVMDNAIDLSGVDKLIHMIGSFVNQFLPLILILAFVGFLISITPAGRRFLGGFL